MDFEPKTREEAEKESQFPIWEAGEYDFEITKADELKSKKGNNMIKLTLKCFNSKGGTQVIFDYLMPAFPVKLIDACDAMGLSLEYQSGTLKDYHFSGKYGKVRISVKSETTNQSTGEKYPAKNEVSSYVVSGVQAAKTGHTSIENDDPLNYDEVTF